MRPVRFLIIGALVAGLFGCSAAPTTTFTDADGESVTVDWADYPGNSGTAAKDLLAAPLEQEIETTSSALLYAISTRLTEEFGVTFTLDGEAQFFPDEGNGYGGESLLVSYNSVDHQTSTIPSDPEDWRGIVDIVSEETERAGLGEVVLSHESASYLRDESWQKETRKRFGTGEPDEFWAWDGTAYGESQWLSVYLLDARRDASGSTLKEYERYDWEPRSIALSYGATTVQEDRRTEFEEKIQPFIGLTPPPSTTSD